MWVLYNTVGTRFICSVDRLLDLAGGVYRVRDCGKRCQFDYKPSGCCIILFGTCENGHVFEWESSDRLGQEKQKHK